MTLRLRDLTDEERAEVQRITRSHTLGAAFVRRAQIVVHAMSGLKAEEIARRMDLCGNTVRYWINRFNARGLDGLEEDRTTTDLFGRAAQRRHHRSPDTAHRVGPALCLLDPGSAGRLPVRPRHRDAAQPDQRPVGQRSKIFIREGLKWRHDETWFGERVDPDFAKKRGSSSSSTRRHRRAA
jgi:transposase-like protein